MTDPYNSATVPVIDEEAIEWSEPDLFDTQRIQRAIDLNREGKREGDDE